MNGTFLLLIALIALICSIAGIVKNKLALMVTGQLIGVLVVFFILF